MLLLPVRRRRPPQDILGIDRANPLTLGLSGALDLRGREIFSATPPTPTGVGTRPVPAVFGDARTWYGAGAASSAGYLNYGATPMKGLFDAAGTVCVVVTPGDTAARTLCGKSSNQSGWVLQMLAGGTVDFTVVRSTVDYRVQYASALAAGMTAVVVCTWDGTAGANAKVYVNGIDGTSTLQAGSGTHAADSTMNLNVMGNAAYKPATASDFLGHVHALFGWKGRALTPAEVRELSANPWQIFQAPTKEVYVDLPAAAPITGTSSLAQAGNTLTAAGALALSGAMAITQPGNTVAAAGHVAIAGSVSAVQDGNVLAANGSSASLSPIAGALAVVQAGNIVVARGGSALPVFDSDFVVSSPGRSFVIDPLPRDFRLSSPRRDFVATHPARMS